MCEIWFCHVFSSLNAVCSRNPGPQTRIVPNRWSLEVDRFYSISFARRFSGRYKKVGIERQPWTGFSNLLHRLFAPLARHLRNTAVCAPGRATKSEKGVDPGHLLPEVVSRQALCGVKHPLTRCQIFCGKAGVSLINSALVKAKE